MAIAVDTENVLIHSVSVLYCLWVAWLQQLREKNILILVLCVVLFEGSSEDNMPLRRPLQLKMQRVLWSFGEQTVTRQVWSPIQCQPQCHQQIASKVSADCICVSKTQNWLSKENNSTPGRTNLCFAKRTRLASAKFINSEFRNASDVQISDQTLRNRLITFRIRDHWPAVRPPLTARHQT